MKLKANSVTLVILGKWNKHVLTPEWQGRNIFATDRIGIEFSTNFDSPFRTTFNEITFMFEPHRVIFGGGDLADEVLHNLERFARNLTSALSETPKIALGFNFGVTLDSTEEINNNFNIPDNQLITDFGWIINSTTINRKLIQDGRITNLTMELNETGVTTLSFNAHYDIIDNHIDGNLLDGAFLSFRDHCLQFLLTSYNLQFNDQD